MGRGAKEVREVLLLLLFGLFPIEIEVSAVSILVLDKGRMVARISSIRENSCIAMAGENFIVFHLFVWVEGIGLVMVELEFEIIVAAQLEVRSLRILLILRRLARVFLC